MFVLCKLRQAFLRYVYTPSDASQAAMLLSCPEGCSEDGLGLAHYMLKANQALAGAETFISMSQQQLAARQHLHRGHEPLLKLNPNPRSAMASAIIPEALRARALILAPSEDFCRLSTSTSFHMRSEMSGITLGCNPQEVSNRKSYSNTHTNIHIDTHTHIRAWHMGVCVVKGEHTLKHTSKTYPQTSQKQKQTQFPWQAPIFLHKPIFRLAMRRRGRARRPQMGMKSRGTPRYLHKEDRMHGGGYVNLKEFSLFQGSVVGMLTLHHRLTTHRTYKSVFQSQQFGTQARGPNRPRER